MTAGVSWHVVLDVIPCTFSVNRLIVSLTGKEEPPRQLASLHAAGGAMVVHSPRFFPPFHDNLGLLYFGSMGGYTPLSPFSKT